MFKCNLESVAIILATEHKLQYGFSCFKPFDVFYVGTKEELSKAGVVNPKDPHL